MTQVLIADDHAAVRASLRHCLEQDLGITQIGEAATGADALELLLNGTWELLVLDINMPDCSGLDILRHVRAAYPRTKVLMLSGFSEYQFAISALRIGASGFLTKESAPAELRKAISAILAGQRYVCAAFAETVTLT